MNNDVKISPAQTFSRRKFIGSSGMLLSGALLSKFRISEAVTRSNMAPVKVNGHLWVYASKYPPDWDSTPDLEKVFSDMSYAGKRGNRTCFSCSI